MSGLIKGLPRYQHVERLGHDDVVGLLDGPVYVQEKLDGANLTVAMLPDVGLVVCSRNQVVYQDAKGKRTAFNGAVDYVLDHPGFRSFFDKYPGRVLRGEWLVRHSISYPAEVIRKFYVFDVQTVDGEEVTYERPEVYEQWLAEFEILTVPMIRSGEMSLADIHELAVGKSLLAPSVDREGVVVKRVGFKNKWGRTTWGKVVSADFREKNKLHFAATKRDPVEIQWASKLDDEFILKEIYKVRDRQEGKVSVKNMQEVLGRVWSEFFHETLWTFVKKERVKEFNFQEARRLVEKKTRDVALAFFNGVIE